MFDESYKHGTGKRARQTEIINAVFNKTPGGWVVDTSKPFFEESRRKMHDVYASDGQVGKPRAIWAAEFPAGDTTYNILLYN